MLGKNIIVLARKQHWTTIAGCPVCAESALTIIVSFILNSLYTKDF